MGQISIAVFPGSFDPMTKGHMDIIVRATRIFETVIVAVLSNAGKSSLFTPEERVVLIQEECQQFGAGVRVTKFSGLLIDFAREVGAHVLVRGLRAVSDYDYEAQMALMNRSLSNHTPNKALGGELETLFLMTREEYSYISSTLVKQVAQLGGNIAHLVPPSVQRALERKFAESSVQKPEAEITKRSAK